MPSSNYSFVLKLNFLFNMIIFLFEFHNTISPDFDDSGFAEIQLANNSRAKDTLQDKTIHWN